MTADCSTLILNELQALRGDFAEHSTQTVQRLTAVEVQLKGVVGNGKPGRMDLLELRTRDLEKTKWHVVGVVAGVSSVVSLLVSCLIAVHEKLAHWLGN